MIGQTTIRQAVKRVALVTLLFCATQALAHDQYRVVGTVTKFQENQLQMKDKDGKTWSIKVTPGFTSITRGDDKTELKPNVLKVGMSLVVDAEGDTVDSLEALFIRIVPAIAPARPASK